MKTKLRNRIVLAAFSLSVGCGSSSNDLKEGNNTGQAGPATNPVAWESVPSQYNPRIEESFFKVDRAEKLQMDLFGFSDDVHVKYSNQLAADEGQLRIFTVYKNSASFGNLSVSRNEKVVSLNRYGRYECSIRIQNGKIVELDGGCFVRVEVVLPANAEIEVYNLKKILTKRYIAIDTITFLKNIKNASWDDDKLFVVKDYLDSYIAVNKTPVLNSNDLQVVLESFLRSENKFSVLQKLNGFITDRHLLREVIDQVFSRFDRDQAYRICGI